MEEQKKIKYGVMWSRMSGKNVKYYKISVDTKNMMDDNGNIPEEVKIIAFRNFYKEEGSKQPDYILYKDDSKEYNVGSEKREYKRTTEKEDDEIDKIGDTMTQEEIDSLGDDEIPF